MTTTTNFAGKTDAKFRAVEDAFRENFDRFPEVGAALCVYVDGVPVVDVWGGHANAARTRPWERDTTPPEPENFLAAPLADPNSITFKTLMNPPDPFLPGTINSPDWRRAEIPAANGHGTAHAIAKLYAALSLGGELDGMRVMSREALDHATMEQAAGPDEVLKLPMRWALGFGLNAEGVKLGDNQRTFGHSGAGGSLGFADPDAHIGFGYVMNQMLNSDTLADPRWEPLIGAVYDALK